MHIDRFRLLIRGCTVDPLCVESGSIPETPPKTVKVDGVTVGSEKKKGPNWFFNFFNSRE